MGLKEKEEQKELDLQEKLTEN